MSAIAMLAAPGCTAPEATDGAFAARMDDGVMRVPSKIRHRGVSPEWIDEPFETSGRRPGDIGPPPPGYWRIRGDVVPGWTAQTAFGVKRGPGLGNVPIDGRGGSVTFDAGADLAWTFVGPEPIEGEYWSGDDDASGRIVSIAPHPTNSEVVWIVSASGGVWRTNDTGATWTPLTDRLPTLNGGAIAVDPSNPSTLWLATGEYQTDSTGAGIFRSLDGGDTWDLMGDTDATGRRFAAIHVHPTNSSIVHAAGRDGYVRTLDGGVTWEKTFDHNVSALVFDTADPRRLVLGRRSEGVFRSLDGGTTWQPLPESGPTDGFSRIVLANSPADPDRLYAAYANGGSVRGTFRSDDFGDTWAELSNTPPFANPQAWYDMYIAADPDDADRVYAGGVSPQYAEAGIIRSLDGGETWLEIYMGTTPESAQTHPDHHTMAFGPGNAIWEGNDGGIWLSRDGGDTWLNRNRSLAVTQQYTVGISPHDDVLVLGGTQDNGSIERVADTVAWEQVIGGDGGFLAYDPGDAAVKYTTYVYLSIQRWIDGDFSNISGPWGSDAREFIAPMAISPIDGDTLFGGTERLWRTENASGAADWEVIAENGISGDSRLTALEPSPADVRLVWTGSTNGRIGRWFDGVWALRDSGLATTSRIADLDASPLDVDEVFVAQNRGNGQRISRSVDGGLTWTNVTGSMPAGYRPTALAVDWRHDPPLLIVGTGAGVLCSADLGVNWTTAGDDLPNVNIGDLVIDAGRGIVVAGTYGRGTWIAPLPGPPPACPADIDGDRAVGLSDLLGLLAAWGACDGCPADVDGDGIVGFPDLTVLLASWGPCP